MNKKVKVFNISCKELPYQDNINFDVGCYNSWAPGVGPEVKDEIVVSYSAGIKHIRHQDGSDEYHAYSPELQKIIDLNCECLQSEVNVLKFKLDSTKRELLGFMGENNSLSIQMQKIDYELNAYKTMRFVERLKFLFKGEL